MPVAVGEGRAPEQWGCSLSHLPNGIGFPDTANLAGLPVAYVIDRIEEFKSGRRECAGRKKTTCHGEMKALAEKLSSAYIREAANYYASLRQRSVVQVVGAALVPKVEVFGYELAAKKKAGAWSLSASACSSCQTIQCRPISPIQMQPPRFLCRQVVWRAARSG